ncbi:MAG: hypothetical protein ACKOBM_06435 [Gammaproteobacteria bacterium]
MQTATARAGYRGLLTRLSSVTLAGFMLAAQTLALLTLAGCGATRVSVPETFPVPLVEKLPLSVGARLDEALVTYRHVETPEVGSGWEIEVGSAQRALFSNLLTGLFTRGGLVADPSDNTGTTPLLAASDLDAVLVPSIEELQFSTPDLTKTDYYEVWIRYRMRLYGPDDALIADWALTAYGQSNARNYNMQGDGPALQAAALAACRDAMTFFIVQFRTIPAVETWLATKRAAAAASAQTPGSVMPATGRTAT